MARGRDKAAVQTAPVEGPWELPEGWRWERLGNIAKPSKGKYQPDPKSSLPFVGLDSIAPHSIQLEGVSQFSEMRSAANAFSAGQILYGRLRPYLNKVWLADRDGACSGEFIVLNCAADIEPAYLRWILHHSGFVAFASHAVSGDRPRIDFKTMSAYPVPVPPLETQRRIVARIDELFSELDDGEAALARAREDLEVYRKALLKAAVTGELTADWRAANPPKETGEQLLKRILAERRARWEADPKNKGKRYKEPAAPDTSDLPELPEGWAWASLQQLAFISGGLTVDRKRQPEDPIELPYLRVANVQRGWLDLREVKTIIVDRKKVPDLLLEKGDVLLNEGGDRDKIGRGWVYEGQIDGCLHQNHVFKARPASTLVSPYVISHYLNELGRRYFIDAGKQTTNLASISLSKVSAVPVAVPPIEEGKVIMQMIDDFEMGKSFEPSELVSLSEQSNSLRQSILAAAFKGELVQ